MRMTHSDSRRPATADSGYITRPERLQNAYTSDPSLKRSLACKCFLFRYDCHHCIVLVTHLPTIGYLPETSLEQLESQLTQLGEEAVSDQVLEWSADAERHQPYVKSYNVWGQRYDYDRLITSEGWKQLGKWGARHG